MKATFALLLLLCAGLAVWGIGERGRGSDLEAALRAANHTRDTIRARNAEREVRWATDNDSLKQVLRRTKDNPARVIVRHDTALVPVTEWVRITDTVIPKCEQCAARLDSLVEQNESERRAALHVETLMRAEIVRLRRSHWYDRFSVGVGYGITKVGPEVYAGPQVQFQVRAWP